MDSGEREFNFELVQQRQPTRNWIFHWAIVIFVCVCLCVGFSFSRSVCSMRCWAARMRTSDVCPPLSAPFAGPFVIGWRVSRAQALVAKK